MSTPSDFDALAAGPLDAADEALLAGIATLYAAVDPVPAGLVDRLSFAISLDALNTELAELVAQPVASSARASGASEVTTLTFTAESLTTMVTVSPAADGRVRIDGWAAPGAGATVELRQPDRSWTVTADEDGRFVFDSVPSGLTRFVVRPVGGNDQSVVITPGVQI